MMKQTEIGMIPKEWKVSDLEGVAYINMGQSPPSASYNSNGEGLPFYQGKTDFGFMYPIKRIFCSEPSKMADKNDILISVRAPVGPVNIANEKCCIGRGIAALKPKNFTDRMFLYFYLMYSEEKIASKGTGSIFKAINKANLVNFPVPTFEISEQRNISHILSLFQTAIQKQEEIISTTADLKNALMQKLFTEGTKNEKQKETEIGLVPNSWQVMPLHKTGDVIYGIQAAVANNTKPVGTKILTNVNINLDGQIVLEKVRYYKLKSKRDFTTVLQQGDILFNWRSGSKEHVGKTAMFDLEGEYTHSSFILRIRPNKEIDNYFLFLYLFYLRATGYFVKQQTYSINAKFNKSAIDVLPVTLPSPDEQKTIAETIRAINKKIEHHETKKKTLTELFNAMLHKLMTGEVRVKDLDLPKEYSSEEESLSMAAEP